LSPSNLERGVEVIGPKDNLELRDEIDSRVDEVILGWISPHLIL